MFRREVGTQVTEPSLGPVIGVFVFLARSRELRRSFGTRGADVVSIASWEALDARTCELVVRASGLAWWDEAFRPDDSEVTGPCSRVPGVD